MARFSVVQMLRRAYSLCRRVFCLLLYNAAGPFASGVLKKAYFLRLPVSFLPDFAPGKYCQNIIWVKTSLPSALAKGGDIFYNSILEMERSV